MSRITACPPCQLGDHENHYRVVQAVPEGVLGGAICVCEGECRHKTLEELVRDSGLSWATIDALSFALDSDS